MADGGGDMKAIGMAAAPSRQGRWLGAVLLNGPFLVAIMLLLPLAAFFVSRTMPVSLYPDVDKPVIRLTVDIDQHPTSFFEQFGRDAEMSLSALGAVTRVEGVYRSGRARLFVEFDWGTPVREAKREVNTVASYLQAQLPERVPPVRVDIYDPATEAYIAFSGEMPPEDLAVRLEQRLVPRVEAIDGVASAWVSPYAAPYVLVEIDPGALTRAGVTMAEVVAALEGQRLDVEFGRVIDENGERVVFRYRQGPRQESLLPDLRDILVTAGPGGVVTLGQLGAVEIRRAPNDRTFMIGGEPVIAAAIWPDPDADVYDVTSAFMKAAGVVAGEDAEIVVLNDPRRFIDSAVAGTGLALFLGVASAGLVVLLVYRRPALAVFVGISMILSICLSLVAMRILGVGINLLSLGAMAVAVGMAIDASVIVADNVLLRLAQRGPGERERDIAAAAVSEVLPNLVSTTLTSVAVFLPLVFTLPVVAGLLSDIALVVTAILLSSLLFSTTCFPFLMTKLRASGDGAALPRGGLGVPASLRAAWGRFILDRRFAAVMSAGAVLAVTGLVLFAMQRVELELVAEPKPQILDTHLTFESDGLVESARLAKVAEAQAIIENAAGPEIRFIYQDVSEGSAYLSAHLRDYRDAKRVRALLEDALSSLEGASATVDPWVTSSLDLTTPPALTIDFLHPSEEANRAAMASISSALSEREEVLRIRQTPSAYKSKELTLKVKKQFAGLLGSEAEVSSLLDWVRQSYAFAVEPQRLYDVRTDEGRLPLRLAIRSELNSLDDLDLIKVPLRQGEIFAGEAVEAELSDSWQEWATRDGRLAFRMEIWTPGREEALAVAALIEEIAEAPPAGMAGLYEIGRGDEEVMAGLRSVFFALIASMILVFVLLLLHFGSASLAAIITGVAVFGVAGALASLLATGLPLSLNAGLGMLILCGLAINNAIMLTSYYLKSRQGGLGEEEAMARAIGRRVRVIIVTTLTTIAGMLPLIIGFGPGEDIVRPLGVTVTVGLLVSLVASFTILPSLLVAVTRRAEQPSPADRARA